MSFFLLYLVSQEQVHTFAHLAICGMTTARLIFKTEILIYQSKVNLDEKNLFGKNHSSFRPINRPFSSSEKESQSNDTLLQTPLDRTSRIKMYENNTRSRLFC